MVELRLEGWVRAVQVEKRTEEAFWEGDAVEERKGILGNCLQSGLAGAQYVRGVRAGK